MFSYYKNMELLEYINSNDWDTDLYRHIKWDWDDCWIQCDKGKHSKNKNLTTEDLELTIKLRGKEWKEVAIYLDSKYTLPEICFLDWTVPSPPLMSQDASKSIFCSRK